MRYWDTSALTPLVLAEPGTSLVQGFLKLDPEIATWGLTRVELASSVERAARDGRLSAADRSAALRRVARLAADFYEVTDLVAVRVRATPLLARHPLRAADAVQLAAALVLSHEDPASLSVVCLDRRLADAAEREGLRVWTWPT